MNPGKEKNTFTNLESNFFLQKLFDNMKRNRQLEILKYNKKLQKKLNLTLNDYKEYSQIYTPIEIEMKLSKLKYHYEFISNLPSESCHIYFDDSKEEVKRNYLVENDKVEKIRIIIDYPVFFQDCLFAKADFISSITFKKFYRNNITNLSLMFFGCSSLKEINFLSFNTENVTSMRSMFYLCTSLEKLDLSKFNTKNVTNMAAMFNGCSSLKELNLSNFDTNNVTDMSGMFFGCSSLIKIKNKKSI